MRKAIARWHLIIAALKHFLNNKHQKIYLILFLFFPLLCSAQESMMLEDTVVAPDLQRLYSRYKLTHWGLSVNTLRDHALSPLLYQGVGVQWMLQYWKYKNNQVLVQNTSIVNSATYANQANDHVISSSGLGYQHIRLYPVGLRHPKMQLYVGGFLHPFLNIKLLPGNINNAVSYDFLISLGTGGLWQYQFTMFGREFILSDQLSLPLLALILRPPFAWPAPTAVEEGGSLLADLQLGSWNRYFSVTNQVYLNFHTNRKRKGQVVKKVSQQLSYTWNYYTIPKANRLQTAAHTITYSRVLKID